MNYLENLNERQKEAVLATTGPVSVLAGAGSGKTKVLTTRIYHLIRQGIAPESILAVTFTNKAAREMRERLGAMLGTELAVWKRGNQPFVATFHGLGRELLEAYGRPLGIPRFFTIFDRDDSMRAVKEALKEMGIDPKEIEPRSILSRISRAKNDGHTATSFAERYARDAFRSKVAADVWRKYEDALKREKALDFDDLLTLPVKLLEEHADIRTLVQERFHYIHIDEFQDTNEIQGRLVSLLAGERKNVMVVGDIDQCLVAGTKITMADKSKKNIELVQEGDEVLSNYGSGDLRMARVMKAVQKTTREDLVRITTQQGRTLVSTPEHVHFAGYRIGLTPQMYFTYLMHKRGMGWRLGVSQTYTKGQRQSMAGFQLRCNQEHGDELWVVGVHESPQNARVEEYLLSLRYSIPTLPFVARKGGSANGYVHDQDVLKRVFDSFDTATSAERLLADKGLSPQHPHHRAQATRNNRRNIVVTLCGDRRGTTAMHRLSVVGSDAPGRRALEEAGFSIRRAKLSGSSWRFETCYANFEKLHEIVRQLLKIFPEARVIEAARLGGKKIKPKNGNSLPFLPAASVLPGMTMFNEETGYDVVQKVERVPSAGTAVYDLDIEGTHNFIANGLHTHNCIYTWRGATIDNLLEFEKKYDNAKTVVLEHNYRSTKTIVDAANQIIEHNRNRKEKRSVTDNPVGDAITLQVAETAEAEAAWIARECKRLSRTGVPIEEMAVLFRTNFQSRALEEAFLAEGIAYRLLGTRFFDRKEVKDVLSWIRLALDPSREADRMRAVQFPTRGIGKVLLGKLVAGKRDELKPSERVKVEAFERIVLKLNDAAKTLPPSAFVRAVITESGIEDALMKGGEEDQERLENAKELATLASRHDEMIGEEGISAFLADASLAGDQDEMDRPQEAKPGGVTLMTVHAAKGLEFDTVFVSGLEEGLFPHQGQGDEDRDQEEERRLFYVAITRARLRLYLTLAHIRRIYGTDFISEPSSFIRDIDPTLVRYPGANDPGEDVIEA